MAVTPVGTPAAVAIQSASNTGSVTGSWSGTQPRTAGHLLVACVTAFGTTTAGTISTPLGWTKIYEVTSTDGRNRVAQYEKVATGADAAPNFTSTLGGTAAQARMSCYLYELTGQDGTTPVVTFGSIGTATTSPATATTSGSVPAAGCYAISAWNVVVNSATTTTYGAGAAWTNAFNEGATSARSHSASDVLSSPSTGTLSEQITATGTITDIAGGLIVVQPPTSTTWTLAGTASSVSAGSGSLVDVVPLAGTASSSSAASGTLGTPRALAGMASNASSTSAAITLLAALSGTAPDSSTASGSLTLQIALAGTASNTSTASGSFPQVIAGTASSTSSASGSLTMTIQLAGTASKTSTASGAFLPAVASGTSSTVSHASGAFLPAPVAGSASTPSLASGNLTIIHAPLSLAGTSSTTSHASGTTGIVWHLLGTSSTTSGATGAITSGGVIRTPLHLGGTVTIAELGGSIVIATYDGTIAVQDALGGSATGVNHLGGSVVLPVNYGGTIAGVNNLGGTAVVPDPTDGSLEGWTMQEVDITLNEFNDMTCNLTITSSGSPLNITGLEIDMLLKTAAGTPDGSATKLSTVTGEIAITNGPGGLATATIPDSDLGTTDFGFYRVDVVNGSNRNTALFGKVTTVPL